MLLLIDDGQEASAAFVDGLPDLFWRDAVDEREEVGNVACDALMEETLADVECYGLAVIHGYAQLSFQLSTGIV